MNTKLALNKFNCGQSNFEQQAYNVKCAYLPKENRKENKAILNLIRQVKRDR